MIIMIMLVQSERVGIMLTSTYSIVNTWRFESLSFTSVTKATVSEHDNIPLAPTNFYGMYCTIITTGCCIYFQLGIANTASQYNYRAAGGKLEMIHLHCGIRMSTKNLLLEIN